MTWTLLPPRLIASSASSKSDASVSRRWRLLHLVHPHPLLCHFDCHVQ